VIRIDVLGTPAPKGSARAFVNKRTGRAILAPGGAKSTEIKIKNWNVAVREAALDALYLQPTPFFCDKPLAVAIVFRMRRPASHRHKKTGQLRSDAPRMCATAPDVDKLARCTVDPLHDLVFDNDSRIVELLVRKEYAAPGREGATITVDMFADTVRGEQG